MHLRQLLGSTPLITLAHEMGKQARPSHTLQRFQQYACPKAGEQNNNHASQGEFLPCMCRGKSHAFGWCCCLQCFVYDLTSTHLALAPLHRSLLF